MNQTWLIVASSLALLGCHDYQGLEEIAPFPCAADGKCPSTSIGNTLFCLPGADIQKANATNGGLCLSNLSCDVLTQNCPSDRPKCARVEINGDIKNRCIPELQKRGQDEPCTPSMRSSTEYGYDECAVGFGCTSLGNFCRAYCSDDLKCPSGYNCKNVGSGLDFGFCAKACTPFLGDCGPNRASRKKSTFSGDSIYQCEDAGSGGNGSRCSDLSDCADSFTCSYSRCEPECDSSHPCPNSRECVSGVCQPCRPFSNDCGAGYTCEPTSHNRFRCKPVGELARDANCKGKTSDCGTNMDCITSSKRSTCRELCSSTHPCSFGTCVMFSNYDDLGFCMCTLFDSSTCPGGQFCGLTGSRTEGTRRCYDIGNKDEGDSCSETSECSASMSCWGSDSKGRFCRDLCDENNRCDQFSCIDFPYLANSGGLCLEE